MVHGRDRDSAIDRLRRALDETEIAGIQTTLPFHRFVARHDGFRSGDLSIDWVAEQWDGPAERARVAGPAPRWRPGVAGATPIGRPPHPASAGGHAGWAAPPERRRRPMASMTALGRPIARPGRRRRPLATIEPGSGSRTGRRHGPASDARARDAVDAVSSADARPILPSGRAPSPGSGGRVALEVVVDGWRFELDVEDADLADLRERARSGREAVVRDGPTEVRAIIPGRVVSVAVEAGDAVTAGQRLLAVEAMKMENELRAPRDGTVERVAVVGRRDRRARRPPGRAPVTRQARSATGPDRDGRARDRPTGEAPDPAAIAGARPSGPRRSRARRSAASPSRPHPASSSATCTPRPTPPPSTRTATSAARASTRSPAASSRRCTAAASGRCASTRGSPRPRRRTAGSATSSSRARRGSRSPSTCRPRWATTPTRRRRKARSAGSASRSRAWPTWRSCSTGCRSARSARR